MPVPLGLHRDKLTMVGASLAMRKMIRHLGVKLTREDRAKIRRATRIERERRRDPDLRDSTLVRELAMPGIERILQKAGTEPASQAVA